MALIYSFIRNNKATVIFTIPTNTSELNEFMCGPVNRRGLAYVCIKLHDHNFRPIVIMWRPFHKCFAKFRRSWDVTASVINAFATFLVLSYWKIMYTSFNLLLKVNVYSVTGHEVGSHHFFYDASLEYFHGKHLPLAIVAIFNVAIFVVLPPVLLCLYPLKPFQKLLSAAGVSGHALSACVDLFQGHYNDGTDGGRDWRWVSGVYFVVRITILAVRITISSVGSYPPIILAVVVVALLMAILRPYKVVSYSYLDSTVFALLALLHFIYLWGNWIIVSTNRLPLWLLVAGFVVAFIPLAIYATIILWCLAKRWRLRQKLSKFYQNIVACCVSRRLAVRENTDVRGLSLQDLDSL